MMPLNVPLNTITALMRSFEHSAEMSARRRRFRGGKRRVFVRFRFSSFAIVQVGAETYVRRALCLEAGGRSQAPCPAADSAQAAAAAG